MRRPGILLGGATMLALAGGVLAAPTAGATAPPPTLNVSPTTVQTGGTLSFSATCYASTLSAVTSPGLVAPVHLSGSPQAAGTGKAVAKPGKYTASFTCSGPGPATPPYASGTATVEFTVVCPPSTPPTTSKPPTGTPNPPTSSPNPPTTSQPTETSQPAQGGGTPQGSTKSCGGSTGTGGTGSSGSSKPQVQVAPKGAPETGDGSEATY